MLLCALYSCSGKQDTPKSLLFGGFSPPGEQVVEVITSGAGDISGMLYLHEKSNEQWACIDSFPVVVGRNGLAVKPEHPEGKKEGDGCSPAGMFKLSRVFSYFPLNDLKMPFEQVDTNDLCVDDINSVYYNTLIDDDTIAQKDYNSFERMQRKDQQYAYGVWVDYNTGTITPGNGSCIFLHIWKSDTTATSGCTAMSEQHMQQLIHWLNGDKNPVLIQYTKPNADAFN